ncbi:hypothetical protein JZ751_010728 [Albula glossodonta]|uniref:Uncharacterized protein n=1 Tax=Albula glossodonta TaxID=121402 RepID=A0A8T2MZD6_9TELE|nr:hypothetical protein JZ751_010728 [Albula glossodonta]
MGRKGDWNQERQNIEQERKRRGKERRRESGRERELSCWGKLELKCPSSCWISIQCYRSQQQAGGPCTRSQCGDSHSTIPMIILSTQIAGNMFITADLKAPGREMERMPSESWRMHPDNAVTHSEHTGDNVQHHPDPRLEGALPHCPSTFTGIITPTLPQHFHRDNVQHHPDPRLEGALPHCPSTFTGIMYSTTQTPDWREHSHTAPKTLGGFGVGIPPHAEIHPVCTTQTTMGEEQERPEMTRREQGVTVSVVSRSVGFL